VRGKKEEENRNLHEIRRIGNLCEKRVLVFRKRVDKDESPRLMRQSNEINVSGGQDSRKKDLRDLMTV